MAPTDAADIAELLTQLGYPQSSDEVQPRLEQWTRNEAGAVFVWMQPGAESANAVARAEELGLHPIAGGPCLLVALGFRE